jgi:NAD(P)H-flavin reductase
VLTSLLLLLLEQSPSLTTCRAPEGWGYSSGFINEDMLREHLLPAGPDAIVAMCGPPPMIKFACIPNLEKLGYTEQQMITF